jgi:hypothetical protein
MVIPCLALSNYLAAGCHFEREREILFKEEKISPAPPSGAGVSRYCSIEMTFSFTDNTISNYQSQENIGFIPRFIQIH